MHKAVSHLRKPGQSASWMGKGIFLAKRQSQSGLNRSIFDLEWNEFRRQRKDKLARNGGKLLKDQANDASWTCPKCQVTQEDMRKMRMLLERKTG